MSAGVLGIACPEKRCGAGVTQPCRNLANGEPLSRRPAHEKRIWNARALDLIADEPYMPYPEDES